MTAIWPTMICSTGKQCGVMDPRTTFASLRITEWSRQYWKCIDGDEWFSDQLWDYFFNTTDRNSDIGWKKGRKQFIEITRNEIEFFWLYFPCQHFLHASENAEYAAYSHDLWFEINVLNIVVVTLWDNLVLLSGKFDLRTEGQVGERK